MGKLAVGSGSETLMLSGMKIEDLMHFEMNIWNIQECADPS